MLLVLPVIKSPAQTQFNKACSSLGSCCLSALLLCFYFPTQMSIRRCVSLQVASCVLASQLGRNIRSYLNTTLPSSLI